jgi:hypothetical protein
MSFRSGSGSYFSKIPDTISGPTFILKIFDFKGPKMAFWNVLLKEYLNLDIKMVKIMKLLICYGLC